MNKISPAYSKDKSNETINEAIKVKNINSDDIKIINKAYSLNSNYVKAQRRLYNVSKELFPNVEYKNILKIQMVLKKC